ncbi:DMT family transporter [Frederiksenia canicola]|uniref:EamA-like transporter family protein n=1 Tax=Frederiksenia canicola TaxID=123824 RepID=A0AAE7C215_9PAST|nr:DMT family transporter [Frederiksenia canicola]QIM64173.1 hypothetical protein A4G17_01255 [Frederiksenia canicola]RPE93711.1 EamA-like transporter family protein [Frederiksenia canicola]
MERNALLGFSLALLATATWGFLPIAAKAVLEVMDPTTFVWFRFAFAGSGLILFLAFVKKLPDLTACKDSWQYILLGVFGLTAYFVGSSYALTLIEATTSQVLWQLSPFTMMICGVVIFKEKFGKHQKIGLALLIIGLVAFFNDRFDALFQLNAYGIGVVFGAISSVVWVSYGVAQKLLLSKFSSQQILLLIYLGCSVVLLPLAEFSQLHLLNSWAIAAFIFCCFSTFVSYGAYAEALNYWDATKVSVVTVLIPIFTMAFQAIGHHILPDNIPPLAMNTLSYFGAFIVIIGTMLSTLGDKLCKK